MKVKNILVSQPRPSDPKSPYFDIEKKYGVHINFRPFIKVEPMDVKEFRKQKIHPKDFTAVIFTAKHGIDNYFRLCKEMRFEVPQEMRYFCVSDKISFQLQKYTQYRRRRVFFTERGKLEDLPAICAKHPNEKFLFVTSDANRDKNAHLFDAVDIDYTNAIMYRTVSNDFTPDEKFDYDLLAFFSPEGAKSLMKNFPDFQQGEIGIVAAGVTTVKELEKNNLRADRIVGNEKGCFSSTPAAIEDFIVANNEKSKKR